MGTLKPGSVWGYAMLVLPNLVVATLACYLGKRRQIPLARYLEPVAVSPFIGGGMFLNFLAWPLPEWFFHDLEAVTMAGLATKLLLSFSPRLGASGLGEVPVYFKAAKLVVKSTYPSVRLLSIAKQAALLILRHKLRYSWWRLGLMCLAGRYIHRFAFVQWRTMSTVELLHIPASGLLPITLLLPGVDTPIHSAAKWSWHHGCVLGVSAGVGEKGLVRLIDAALEETKGRRVVCIFLCVCLCGFLLHKAPRDLERMLPPFLLDR
jgi:hypothetical protein